MMRLFQIEFQKIWQNRASRILTMTYFVLLTFIALLASFDFNVIGIDFRMAEMGIFNFPFIWHFNTYIASIAKLFLAIVIVSMMANEYSYGTLKQNLIDGMSKKEFILSKFYTVVVFALLSTVFIFILNLILGYSFSSYDELSIVFTDVDYMLAYFVKLVAFFTFCLFIGIFIKRSAFALGFLVIWNIIEFFFVLILSKILPENSTIPDTINRFLPLESMSQLIFNPFRRLSLIKSVEEQMGGTENLTDYSVNYFQLFIVLCWIVIFVLMSFKILKNRDL